MLKIALFSLYFNLSFIIIVTFSIHEAISTDLIVINFNTCIRIILHNRLNQSKVLRKEAPLTQMK